MEWPYSSIWVANPPQQSLSDSWSTISQVKQTTSSWSTQVVFLAPSYVCLGVCLCAEVWQVTGNLCDKQYPRVTFMGVGGFKCMSCQDLLRFIQHEIVWWWKQGRSHAWPADWLGCHFLTEISIIPQIIKLRSEVMKKGISIHLSGMKFHLEIKQDILFS